MLSHRTFTVTWFVDSTVTAHGQWVTIGILWGKGCDTASALWTLLRRGSSCICNLHSRGHRPATIWHADQYLDIWRRPALNLSEAKKDFCTFLNEYHVLKLHFNRLVEFILRLKKKLFLHRKCWFFLNIKYWDYSEKNFWRRFFAIHPFSYVDIFNYMNDTIIWMRTS